MNPQYISRNDISDEELAKLREITVDSALMMLQHFQSLFLIS